MPPSSKILHVFHVSLLKKVIGQYTHEPELPTDLSVEFNVEPEAVLGIRSNIVAGQKVTEYLIKWKGMTTADSTWKEEYLLISQFPHFRLRTRLKLERAELIGPWALLVGLMKRIGICC